MTIQLTLPIEIEEKVVRCAKAGGSDVADWLLRIITQRVTQAESPQAISRLMPSRYPDEPVLETSEYSNVPLPVVRQMDVIYQPAGRLIPTSYPDVD